MLNTVNLIGRLAWTPGDSLRNINNIRRNP